MSDTTPPPIPTGIESAEEFAYSIDATITKKTTLDVKWLTKAITSRDAAIRAEAEAQGVRRGEAELEKEQGRWQEAIYNLICERCPEVQIDGKGCDSGDPLDFTLAEIGQALAYWQDKHDESVSVSFKRAAEIAEQSEACCGEGDRIAKAITAEIEWVKVEQNLSAIGRHIDAQRAQTRYGCGSIEQAFRGYLAIPERCGGLPWWDVLHVPSNANRDSIEAAYRMMVKTHHPDKGGSHAEFTKLQEAYDQAMAQFHQAA